MSSYEVSKTFKFDAAHRLIDGYVGKCSNLHGHTWKVMVTLSGPDLDEFGMLYDFTAFKSLKAWIDQRLDHVTILNVSDALTDLLVERGHRVYTMIDNPTSENLAREIYYEARRRLLGLVVERKVVEVKCVEVWESENSKAVYYG